MEPIAALDHDVEAAVVEPFEHLDDCRRRAHLANAGIVGEDQAELALVVEALADELAVARLEDVQGDALSRQKNDSEREQPDLGHGDRVRSGT